VFLDPPSPPGLDGLLDAVQSGLIFRKRQSMPSDLGESRFTLLVDPSLL
jgi:hypothetical protein